MVNHSGADKHDDSSGATLALIDPAAIIPSFGAGTNCSFHRFGQDAEGNSSTTSQTYHIRGAVSGKYRLSGCLSWFHLLATITMKMLATQHHCVWMREGAQAELVDTSQPKGPKRAGRYRLGRTHWPMCCRHPCISIPAEYDMLTCRFTSHEFQIPSTRTAGNRGSCPPPDWLSSHGRKRPRRSSRHQSLIRHNFVWPRGSYPDQQ